MSDLRKTIVAVCLATLTWGCSVKVEPLEQSEIAEESTSLAQVAPEDAATVEPLEMDDPGETVGSNQMRVRAALEVPDWTSETNGNVSKETYFSRFQLAEAERVYLKVNDFKEFRPPSKSKVGEVWTLKKGTVAPFLQQVHQGFTEEVTRDGAGTFAVLRARSDSFEEVLFRCHAEAKIDEALTLSPAQFEGRIVFDRKTKAAVAFHIRVPSDYVKNLNYEFSGDDAQVGMVLLPRLELSGGKKFESFQWGKDLSLETARAALAKQFFPFEKIAWVEVEDAPALAEEQGKPIMAIVIEGVLNDQSC